MGAHCPTCQKYEPIQAVHTLNGQPPKKSQDVIYVSLGCGHAFGRDQFNDYQIIAAMVQSDAAAEIAAIQEAATKKISLMFAEYVQKHKEGSKK